MQPFIKLCLDFVSIKYFVYFMRDSLLHVALSTELSWLWNLPDFMFIQRTAAEKIVISSIFQAFAQTHFYIISETGWAFFK